MDRTRNMPLQLAVGTLFGLIICLLVGIVRNKTNALLAMEQQSVCTERAYQRERALNDLKDQALQDLQHELRTPLTQIEGYLELLETYRDTLDEPTQGRFIAFARSGCDELLSVIETALAMALAPVEQSSSHMRVFSLQHEVQAVIDHLEPSMLYEHPVELAIAESIRVDADACFFRQILRNLLTNACKYTPAQTPILVSAVPMKMKGISHDQTGMVCVRVSDQGPGIPPDQQSQLFQRFVRLPNAITRTQPGSGLGLAICKQLVEAMEGTIWVESTGRSGDGCCFAFTLMNGQHRRKRDEEDNKETEA